MLLFGKYFFARKKIEISLIGGYYNSVVKRYRHQNHSIFIATWG
jgi:hypothetical protein